MSNELPQAPTEMCEPVITGSNYVGQEMSVKKLKHILKLYFGYYRVGRIKRVRAKDVYPFVDLTKRTRKKYADAFPRCFATITRWNRH